MALTVSYKLSPGVAYKLIDAATAVGTARTQLFTTHPFSDMIVTLVPLRTGAFTALTVDLEVSPDAGTTWEKHTTGLNLFTGAVRVAIGPNQYCRLNVITFTGGTSFDAFGTFGAT